MRCSGTGTVQGNQESAPGEHSHSETALEQLSTDAYAELVAHKMKSKRLRSDLTMRAENLAVIQKWLCQEQEIMAHVRAENDALRSELQAFLPESNFNSLNMASARASSDELAAYIEEDMANIVREVYRVLSSTGCKTDLPFQSTQENMGFVSEQDNFKTPQGASHTGSEYSDGCNRFTEARWRPPEDGSQDEEAPDPFSMFYYGDEAQRGTAEEHFDMTSGTGEEAPNPYVSCQGGLHEVPNASQNLYNRVECSQIEVRGSCHHVFHGEECVQAWAHHDSPGGGEKLHGRFAASCHASFPVFPCSSHCAPSSNDGTTPGSGPHLSYPNNLESRSGHSSAHGPWSNVYGPSPGQHCPGACRGAQRRDQSILAQHSNQQSSRNPGNCFAPNDRQWPVRVGPGPPRRPQARQLRAMEPGTSTIMVRNIPARYNKERLLREWPVQRHRFNMLHLPENKRGMSLGYAFLNFVMSEHALAFQRCWHGRRLANHGPNKHLDVSQARVQGLVESLRDMLAGMDTPAWRSETCVPLVFEGTRSLDIEEVLLQYGLTEPRVGSRPTFDETGSLH